MLSDVVGEQIAFWRKARDWSREQLSEACQALGMKLTMESIANIESGRRSKDGVRRRVITVDELVVFTLALNVPLTALLIPYPSQEQVELTPAVSVSTIKALDWFDAELCFSSQEGRLVEPIPGSEERDSIFWSARMGPYLLRFLRSQFKRWLTNAEELTLIEQRAQDFERDAQQSAALLDRAEAALKSASKKLDDDLHSRNEMDAFRAAVAEEQAARATYAVAQSDAERMRRAREDKIQGLRHIETLTLRVRETLDSLGYPVPALPAELSHLAEMTSSKYDGDAWRESVDRIISDPRLPEMPDLPLKPRLEE
jgi:transcriptional regulator with XRE-family HTH domain